MEVIVRGNTTGTKKLANSVFRLANYHGEPRYPWRKSDEITFPAKAGTHR